MLQNNKFSNLLADIFQDFQNLPNRKVDQSHLEVMDSLIKRVEDLKMDVSKVNPKFSSSDIDISYKLDGRLYSETVNISDLKKDQVGMQ